MKLSNIVSTSELARLDELNATVPGATMTGTAAPTAAPAQDPNADAKARALAATQARDRRVAIQQQMKEIDEQIRSLTQQKADLQKQLSTPASTI